MSTAPRPRIDSLHDRVSALEKLAVQHDNRAAAHEATMTDVAGKVGEIYEAWRSLKAINWFVVKVTGGLVAFLGAIAVVLTILDKLMTLYGHH